MFSKVFSRDNGFGEFFGEGQKIEQPGESVMLLDDTEPYMTGGTVVDEQPLGELGVKVFRGSAALEISELNRHEAAIGERQRRSSSFRRGSLDDRLHRLGVI
jgi:hypothetical protein